MFNFFNINEIKKLFQKYEISFQKKFGQNFIIDKNIILKIINLAKNLDTKRIIEIGPGIGTLSYFLKDICKELILIEIDNTFYKILSDFFKNENSITIINSDFLKIADDLFTNTNDISVISNLPYYITTPILEKCFTNLDNINQMIFMVQKEYTERLMAKKGTKNYGSLTVFANYYVDIVEKYNISRNSFYPIPNVDSAIIRLLPKKKKHFVENEKLFFSLVRASFNYRRKTFVNSLLSSDKIPFDKTIIIDCLNTLNINEKIRGELLSIDDFCKIANFFQERI